MSKFFYTFAKIVCWPFLYPLYLWRFEGRENLKYEGKMLIYCNHLSFMDVVMLAYADKHYINIMAKEELFRNKFFAKIITWLGAFPVDRDHGGLTAMKKGCDILEEDKTLLIFPEGTRNRESEDIQEFHPGISMIAARTETPLIPVLITHRPKKFRRNVVRIGKPFQITDLYEEGLTKSQNTRQSAEKLREILNGMKDKE